MRRIKGQIASFHKLRFVVPKKYYHREGGSWEEWSTRAKPYLALNDRNLHQLFVWAGGQSEIVT
eukprot:837348-Lingulodinium_polyedra.AAC.1